MAVAAAEGAVAVHSSHASSTKKVVHSTHRGLSLGPFFLALIYSLLDTDNTVSPIAFWDGFMAPASYTMAASMFKSSLLMSLSFVTPIRSVADGDILSTSG